MSMLSAMNIWSSHASLKIGLIVLLLIRLQNWTFWGFFNSFRKTDEIFPNISIIALLVHYVRYISGSTG